MAILMITYDTEMYGSEVPAFRAYLGDRADDPTITKRWIETAMALHSRYQAPCTSYIVGKLLEKNIPEFQAMSRNPLFDMQSHTYSHKPLKTIVCEAPHYRRFWAVRKGRYIDEARGVTCSPGASLELIREEVRKTRDLLKESCGVDCTGISGPGGYYRGLSDRPDVLQVLWEEGVRFSRSYARNENDFTPVSFDAQPFWYRAQEFPDLMELPANGYQDVFWRDLYGWDHLPEYLEHLKACVDLIVERDLVWTYCTHDWSSIENDPTMSVIEGLIRYAQDRGVEILSQRAYYERRLAERSQATVA
jgi:peptidoglycan/xylan/chitin deacetylase (PgdA/CDA1 family)